MLAFVFGAALTLIDPPSGRQALGEIDWSTVLLVGGIITYVGVLQEAGTVDVLGEPAAGPSVPLLAAFLICVVCALISAFASTSAILAALVPLAIPLVAQGGVPGWALICALGVCSSLVDVSPFSTVGATMVASATDPAERPRMTSLLTRWGLSMVVVGPAVLLSALVLPAMAFWNVPLDPGGIEWHVVAARTAGTFRSTRDADRVERFGGPTSRDVALDRRDAAVDPPPVSPARRPGIRREAACARTSTSSRPSPSR